MSPGRWRLAAAALALCLAPGGPSPATGGELEVLAFEASEVEGADEVRLEWTAQTRGLSAGVRRGRVRITLLDLRDEPVRVVRGPVRAHRGTHPVASAGTFSLARDDWFRAEQLEVDVEALPPLIDTSGLLLRRLSVLPGTPMSLGGFVPLRWSVVAGNAGRDAADARLELRLWAADGTEVGVYPVRRLTLAPGSRVRLEGIAVVGGDHWGRVDSVSIDALPAR